MKASFRSTPSPRLLACLALTLVAFAIAFDLPATAQSGVTGAGTLPGQQLALDAAGVEAVVQLIASSVSRKIALALFLEPARQILHAEVAHAIAANQAPLQQVSKSAQRLAESKRILRYVSHGAPQRFERPFPDRAPVDQQRSRKLF